MGRYLRIRFAPVQAWVATLASTTSKLFERKYGVQDRAPGMSVEDYVKARPEKRARLEEGRENLILDAASKGQRLLVKNETAILKVKKTSNVCCERIGGCVATTHTARVIVDPGHALAVDMGPTIAGLERSMKDGSCFVKALRLSERAWKILALALALVGVRVDRYGSREAGCSRSGLWEFTISADEARKLARVIAISFDGKAWDGSLRQELMQEEIFQ